MKHLFEKFHSKMFRFQNIRKTKIKNPVLSELIKNKSFLISSPVINILHNLMMYLNIIFISINNRLIHL